MIKRSSLWIPTKKDINNEDAKYLSHKWLLRSGMIKQLSSGIYSWMPLGLLILKNIKKIIRIHMKKIGAEELLLPILQPTNIWSKTNRIQTYGNELFKLNDRSNKQYLLAPTHEENIVVLLKDTIQYNDMPRIFFQIQTKFRDEIRPKAGIIRAREFIMKDAYSFHNNKDSLDNTYNKIKSTYIDIYKSFSINPIIVKAETGPMGGDESEEFHILCDAGEDKLVYTEKTKEYTSINTFTNRVNLSVIKGVKLKINYYKDITGENIIIITNLNRSINSEKIEKISSEFNLKILPSKEKNSSISIDILNLENFLQNIVIIPTLIFIDHEMEGTVVGSLALSKRKENNKTICTFNKHKLIFCDIRDPSEDEYLNNKESGPIKIVNCLELGHIFKLGNKYTKSLDLFIQNKDVKENPIMGCYGIGITRLLAAIIEKNCNGKYIDWPNTINPFHIAIIPIIQNDDVKIEIMDTINRIYKKVKKNNNEISFIIEDRYNLGFGKRLKDLELIGAKIWIIIGHEYFNNKKFELCTIVKQNEKKILSEKDLLDVLSKIVTN